MTKKEIQELDLEKIPKDFYVTQAEAARLLARFRAQTQPEKYSINYTISRSHIFNLTRHKVHSKNIKMEGKNVNLYDILHLPVLKAGRPAKETVDATCK